MIPVIGLRSRYAGAREGMMLPLHHGQTLCPAVFLCIGVTFDLPQLPFHA